MTGETLNVRSDQGDLRVIPGWSQSGPRVIRVIRVIMDIRVIRVIGVIMVRVMSPRCPQNVIERNIERINGVSANLKNGSDHVSWHIITIRAPVGANKFDPHSQS